MAMLYIAVCIGILLVLWKSFRTNPALDALPGPPKWPIFGSAFLVLGRTQSELFEFFNEFPTKYGNVVGIQLFNTYTVHLYNPEDIKIVLSSQTVITKSSPYSFLDDWLGSGLLLSTGPLWQMRRKILTPAFHFEILKVFAKVFEEESREMIRDLQARVQHGTTELDVMEFFSDYTLSIICGTAMGISLNSNAKESTLKYKNSITAIGEIFMRRLTTFWLWSDFIFHLTATGRQFYKLLKDTSVFTNNVINERRSSNLDSNKLLRENKKRALLDLLLEAEKRGEIDMEGIRNEVDTFLFEGHDTTATAMTFGSLLLADHEDVQEKIYEECQSIFGDSPRTANTSDLAQMKYLEAVIKEILRLYPSVPSIGRNATEDVKLTNDVTIPKGTEITLHIFEVQRREDLFPDAESFKPERFLNGANMHFNYIPFSAGPRNCIGQRYAMQEMKYMFSEMVRHFRLAPIKKGYRPKIKADIVLRPDEPIRVKFSPR